jgi:hypothetical protein
LFGVLGNELIARGYSPFNSIFIVLEIAMHKSFVIQWASKTNGRMGKGTTVFEREDAERLTEELNRDYPDIHHEVVAAPDRAENGEPAGVVPVGEAAVP